MGALRMTPERYAELQARRVQSCHVTHGAVRIEDGKGNEIQIVAAKPNKHGAIATMRGELRFDSKHEAECWDGLCLRLLAGDVTHLQRQVTFPFVVSGVRVGHYKADFFYRTTDGAWHVADAKSKHTRTLPGWHRTRQLMHACYGVDIEEI